MSYVNSTRTNWFQSRKTVPFWVYLRVSGVIIFGEGEQPRRLLARLRSHRQMAVYLKPVL